MKKIYLSLFVMSTAFTALAQQQRTLANFSPGNLVIYRVGDGSAALSGNATPVFLDEYSLSGSLVQTIALPTTVSGSNKRITAAGTSTSEGLLNRTTDKQYLLATGYDASLGTAGITTSSSASVNRVVGRIAYNGSVDATTALSDFSTGSNPRSATSINGTDIWVTGGAGGIRYTTFGSSTSTQISTTSTNLRATNIFGSQLYVTSSSGAIRLATVGTGTPTTSGQTITNLPGFPTATGSPYGFFFADLDLGVAGVDVVYVADDAAGTGFQKFSLVGGNWVANGNVAVTGNGLRGVTATVAGTTVTLYGISGTNLFTLTDASGYNATLSGTATSLATAATNTAFRGVAFTPEQLVPAPVRFVNVKAYQQNTAVAINWANLTEMNLKNYEVERSVDGKNFTSVGTVSTITNSSSRADYTFRDMAPSPSLNYYRIKASELTGAVFYTTILKVALGKSGMPGIAIYPNPVNGNSFALQLNNLPAGKFAVKLFSPDGREQLAMDVSRSAGSSTELMTLPATIKAGMYTIVVTNDSTQFTSKLLVE